MKEYPHAHVTLLSALNEHLEPPELIVIRGAPEEINAWRESIDQSYAPRRLVFAIDANETDLPGILAERKPVPGETVAYRCVGTHCELPVTSWEALAEQL